MSPNIFAPVDFSNCALPVFFVQIGGEPGLFLKKVLKQAVITNGHQNVFILTDNNFDFYNGINCIDISKYIVANTRFTNLYRHHSNNTLSFEKACFDRWFIINALVKEYDICHFFHADCDVLLLQDIKPVYDLILAGNYTGSTMYYSNGKNSVTSAHSSFWSCGLLEDFCDFVCDRYADQKAFNILLSDTLSGKFLDNRNVSDMIFLDVFRTETKPNTLNLLSLEEVNMAFDFNANVAYGGWKFTFKINSFFRIKTLKRYKGNWCGEVKNDDKNRRFIQLYTLHFQGYLTKSLIPVYINHKNFFASLSNWIVGFSTFTVRKLKLLKTHIKDTLKRRLQIQ